MKKLNSINWISFKEDKIYLEDIPINLGENIFEWLNKYCGIHYEFEKYSQSYPESERIKFNDFEYISIYLENKIIESIKIYPRVWEYDNKCYQGDIYIFNKKLEVPFRSDDIEKYFQDIVIKPKGYWKRFAPRENIYYPVGDSVEIEISMGRDPEFVCNLNLKKR